jgi:hypothetical protein
MRRAVVLVIALVGVGCSSNDDEVDREKCTRLRDQMITLRLKGLEGSPDVNVAAHRAALEQSMGDDFIASCQRSLTATQIRRAMAVDDLANAQECSRSSVAAK